MVRSMSASPAGEVCEGVIRDEDSVLPTGIALADEGKEKRKVKIMAKDGEGSRK